MIAKSGAEGLINNIKYHIKLLRWLAIFPEICYNLFMTQTDYKPYTIDELVTTIYEDNYSHFDFMDNMNGGDCDCNLHATMDIIMQYWGN